MSIIIITAAAVSFALTPLVRNIAVKFNVVSRPDKERKQQVQPVAQWGGLAVYLALLASIAVGVLSGTGRFGDYSLPAAIALSGGLLCLLGAYDDVAEIRARWKLAGQIVAVAPAVMAGYYFERISLCGFCLELGRLGPAATIVWMILAINAMNLIDGMDGLASVIGITMAAAVALIALNQSQHAVMILALVTAASLAGFIVYNLPPARIYLGDCGSMLIGFTLALLVMQVSLYDSGSANLTVVAVLFFVPLLDTGLAVVRRTLKGKSFATADREHVHHKLLDRGLSPVGVLALLGGLCLLGGVDAWLTITTRREVWAWIALGALLAVLVDRRLIGHEEWSNARRILLQTAMRIARRPAMPQSSAQPRPAMPRFHWRIISDRGLAESAEMVESIPATQQDNSANQSDKKAA